MEKKRKKKAIVMSTVVGLIILILGFAILVFAFMQINWTGDVNSEVCHQSVIYRATLPSFADMKEYVPLKCKTEKKCITTKSSGKCSEFLNEKGVVKIKVRDVEDVEQAIAKEIVSCWETMGEGKVAMFNDFFVQTYGFGKLSSSCVVCSRIAFDNESLSKAGINLSSMNVRNYMITHKMPGKEVSYYIYLTGNGGLMSIKENENGKIKIDNVVENNNKESISTEEVELDSKSNQTDPLKELSVMFMQVQEPPTSLGVLKNNLYTLTGVAGFGTSVMGVKFLKYGVNVGRVVWPALIVLGIAQQGSVYENQAFAASRCGDVSLGSSTSNGCSVVRTVNYGAEDLSKYCSKIESIP